jgi:hypothetical protein
MKFVQPVKKRPRTSYPTPEVHIALNITPAPQGAEGTQTHGSYIVLAPIAQLRSTSTPGLTQHPAAEVSNTTTKTSSTTAPVPITQQPSGPTCTPRMAVVTECVARSRRPSVLEVLRLMDAKEPRRDLRYADAHSELCDHGITDILDVYTYPVQLLAPLGNLGRV